MQIMPANGLLRPVEAWRIILFLCFARISCYIRARSWYNSAPGLVNTIRYRFEYRNREYHGVPVGRVSISFHVTRYLSMRVTRAVDPQSRLKLCGATRLKSPIAELTILSHSKFKLLSTRKERRLGTGAVS
jgi:hypothetical protein